LTRTSGSRMAWPRRAVRPPPETRTTWAAPRTTRTMPAPPGGLLGVAPAAQLGVQPQLVPGGEPHPVGAGGVGVLDHPVVAGLGDAVIGGRVLDPALAGPGAVDDQHGADGAAVVGQRQRAVLEAGLGLGPVRLLHRLGRQEQRLLQR